MPSTRASPTDMLTAPTWPVTATRIQNNLAYGRGNNIAIQDAEVGDFTLYHWLRMLVGRIAEIMTYEPLVDSLTISLGATRTCSGDRRIDGLVGCSNRYTRAGNHPHAGNHSLHHAFLDDRYGMDGFLQEQDIRRYPGVLEFLTGYSAARLAGVRTISDHRQQWTSLLHLLFPLHFRGVAFNRFIIGRSR